MTSPDPTSPADVRELAAEAAFDIAVAARGMTGLCTWEVQPESTRDYYRTRGDALLAAVSPMLEEQAAKKERDRVAFSIDAFAKNLEMNSAEGDWEEALNALKDAAAIARTHAHPEE